MNNGGRQLSYSRLPLVGGCCRALSEQIAERDLHVVPLSSTNVRVRSPFPLFCLNKTNKQIITIKQ